MFVFSHISICQILFTIHELDSTKLIGKSRFAFLDYLRSQIIKKGESLINLDMVMMDEEVYFSFKLALNLISYIYYTVIMIFFIDFSIFHSICVSVYVSLKVEVVADTHVFYNFSIMRLLNKYSLLSSSIIRVFFMLKLRLLC